MRYFLFITMFFISTGAIAQNNVQQLSFQRVGENEGLSNGIINSIAKDKNGFMWIATFDGLNRFDGTHFTNFRNNRSNTKSIAQNTVHGLCVDSNNDIWCATQTGISCFHQQTQDFENFTPDSSGAYYYFDIVCDYWGTIWCAGEKGLFQYIPKNKSFIPYNSNGRDCSLTSTAFSKKAFILSPDKKSLWLATTKGINNIDIAGKQIFNYKNNPKGLAIFDSTDYYPISFDKKAKLVYGQDYPKSGFWQYDFITNTKTWFNLLFSKRVGYGAPAARIFIDDENNYWISTWGYTLFKFNTSNNTIQEFYHDDASSLSVSADFFWDALQDDEGTIWFGTTNGLSYFNNRLIFYQLRHPFNNEPDPKHHYVIRRFAEDKKGVIWFLSLGSLSIFKYDLATGKLEVFPWNPAGFSKSPDFELNTIAFYKEYLLFATQKGIYSFNTMTNWFDDTPLKKLKKVLVQQEVETIKVVNDSLLYVLTANGEIINYSFKTNAIKTISPASNSFLAANNDKYVNDLVSSNGSWLLMFNPLKIGKYNPGENRLDSLPMHFPPDLKVVAALPVSFKEDARGDLWICPKGMGLIRFSPATGDTKVWQQSDGLINNFVFGNAVDNTGKIWIAGYNKFSVFDPLKDKFENFNLPIFENIYNYSNRFINLQNGNLLCNIYNSFIEFFPSKTEIQKTNEAVLINAVKVFDSTRQIKSNTVELSYKENFFTIAFGILTGLEKNRYKLQYKLEGFNDNWIEADALNTATYTNVPEKEFVFKVRAVATDSSWQGKETELMIRVIPPFYRTTWFRVLAALLFAFTVVMLIRYRINSIRKSEEQKNQVNKKMNEWRLKALRSQMNPHFVFNCMNSIDFYILKNDAENASRYLNKFAKLVRLILNQSDETTIPLSKEIEMLKYYTELEMLRFDTPFACNITIDKVIDADETEIPSMLLQPYVENAILHGLRHRKGAGHLSINIKRKKDLLHCVIEDDGVGREASTGINATRSSQHESKGIKLTEERLQMIDANDDNKTVVHILDLKDENGNATGTRVEIDIAVHFEE